MMAKLNQSGATVVQVLGLGPTRQFLFGRSAEGLDLYDTLVAGNPFGDERFYLLFRVPDDDSRQWSDEDIARIEAYVRECLGSRGIEVHLEHLFGRDFPRGIHACWYLAISNPDDFD